MKKDIKCPKCGTVFQVDESEYAAIAAQVRTAEFEEELGRRMTVESEKWKASSEAEKLRAERLADKRLAEKGEELNALRQEITKLTSIITNQEAAKKAEMKEFSAEKDRALDKAIADREKVIADKEKAFDKAMAEKEKAFDKAMAEKEKAFDKAISDKDKAFDKAMADKEKEIIDLNSRLGGKDNEFQIRMLEEEGRHKEEIQKRETEIERLKSKAETEELAAKDRENQLRESHRNELQSKQEEIDRLKDFKSRLSTKMVGETLEQHCQILFEQAQSMGLFPDAYFNKDNTVVDGSKGDFIFRDYEDGDEYVSIMFEMKNEVDTTATKHRNDDFLEKLHKDRQRKNCEYAVLVSMLEKENELYNNGIVDKSHKYPKMIVIRPQFFMPVIRLISEGAKKGYKERKHLMEELENARSQSLDFTNFEKKINNFRDNFSKSISAAHKKFQAATEGIDKTIEALEKQIKSLREIKANFEASEQKLLKADEYAEENLTVKKLTYGLPGIRKQIEEAGRSSADQ